MTSAFAGQFVDVRDELAGAKTAAEKVRILKSFTDLDREAAEIIESVDLSNPQAIKDAESYVNLRAMLEGGGLKTDASSAAKKIKASRFYVDPGEKQQSNWLSNAMQRLASLFSRKDTGESSGPNLPNVGFPAWINTLVWFLLGGLVVGFIIYAVRFMNFRAMRKRRAKAVMDDDEPERTLDEWLALADQFEREGKIREAVRALYLACLLKFDERGVARFMRGQTNWEHLARIEGSPKAPPNLDFRAPTKTFDSVWYGYKVRGSEDVDQFRHWYGAVTTALQERAA